MKRGVPLIVEVLYGRLKMQVMRMGCWGGGKGVAVVHREPTVSVPVEVVELAELIKLLVLVASVKVSVFPPFA